jgi:hypothetical protein
MHLGRIRVGLRCSSGTPELFKVTPEEIIGTCVEMTLAMVRRPA